MASLSGRAGMVLFWWAVSLHGQSVQQFVSTDPNVRQTAFRDFASLPKQQKDAYIADLSALLHRTPSRWIVPAFAKIGRPAIPALVGLLSDHDRAVRGLAAESIAAIRPVDPENINKLRALLNDEDNWVRQRAAESLLSVGADDDNAKSIVRDEWKALAIPPVRNPPGSFPDWIPLMASDDITVAASAKWALANAGEPAVPDLIDALRNPNSDIRANAADALNLMHIFRSDIESASIDALHDPSVRVREAARGILLHYVSEAAMTALLEDEVAEVSRKNDSERPAKVEPLQARTREYTLASIPPDPDHKYPLEVEDHFEAAAPDGTLLFVVLHRGEKRGDQLRIWRVRGANYLLLKERTGADFGVQLSANRFRYQGKAYLHIMELSAGTGYEHTDEIYRIESGGLHPIAMPRGLPPVVQANEGVWKGLGQAFQDDSLKFEFGIYNPGDANCCPSAGWATGTYAIVGDEMEYATWSRSKDRPQ